MSLFHLNGHENEKIRALLSLYRFDRPSLPARDDQ